MAPGRDDLTAANIARANAAVNSSSRGTGNLAGATSSVGSQSFSAPKSRMGANLDVLAALDSIEFQGKDGDGSMRGNIAYIRRWKRGNTAQTTGNTDSVSAEAVNTTPEEAVSRDIAERYGEERERLGDDQAIRYNPGDPFYTVESGTVTRDEDGNIIEGSQETFFVNTSEQQTRKNNLAPTVPTSSTSGSNGGNNVTTTVVPEITPATTATGAVTTTDSTITGKLKPANPNGFVNAVSRIGKNVLGVPSSPPTYEGEINSSKKGASVPLAEGMWQFLFNPSELELEAGPEFKTAETWGVSDKANSGQPLHWSHNKNALLKFNSVLLNGFVFGRKVEALEQGLLELFMARDGSGQDGPHVLEFVWGKRVFGPCVIKNVSVKEKQWDEGEVVNAELSFTLEQVPEWTINDGFVDVARPGRQPTVASPATSSAQTSGAGTGTPSTDTDPNTGGGKNPSQKPATPQQQEDFIGCRNLQQLKLNATGFNPSAGAYRSSVGPLIPGIGSATSRGPYQSNFVKNYSSYNSFVAKGNSLGVTTSGKCVPSAIKAEHDRLTKNSTDSLKEIADRQMASFINSCANELGNKAGSFFDQKGCKRFTDPSNTSKPI